MQLPKAERSGKRSETRDLVQPIIRALNRMPGVRVARNANLGPVVPWARRHEPDARPIVSGLGTGSADIVGIVRMSAVMRSGEVLGRALAIEVKLPADGDHRAGVVRLDQRRWLQTFQRFGGHAAVVRSIAEAVAAVEACRAGI